MPIWDDHLGRASKNKDTDAKTKQLTALTAAGAPIPMPARAWDAKRGATMVPILLKAIAVPNPVVRRCVGYMSGVHVYSKTHSMVTRYDATAEKIPMTGGGIPSLSPLDTKAVAQAAKNDVQNKRARRCANSAAAIPVILAITGATSSFMLKSSSHAYLFW